MLRESSRLEGNEIDLQVVTSGESTQGGASGVPAELELVAFAEASVGVDKEATERARVNLSLAIGEQGVIDAAGIVANFQRMVKIADGTGIPLDKPVALITAGMREDLGIDNFRTAANTPPVKGLSRLFGAVLNKIVPFVFRRMAKK